MRSPLSLALIAAVASVAVAPAAFAQADGLTRFEATTLNLSAQGEVQVAPDEAFLQTGVSTIAPTAAEAVARNRAKMNAVISAMSAQGVSGPDVQTSALELTTQYADDNNGPRRMTGYQAHNIVSVRVRDLSHVGSALDALVAAGANEIEGVTFDRADRAPAEDEARRLAVRALQAKADLYAEATGYHVKRLVSLTEGGGPVFTPMAPMARAMMFTKAGPPTPVAPGELTVRVDVNAQYELAR